MVALLSIFFLALIWGGQLLSGSSNAVNGRRVKVSIDFFSGALRLINSRHQSVELLDRDGKLMVQRVSNDADRFEDCYGTSYLGVFGVFKLPQGYCLGVITSSIPVPSAPIQDIHAIESVNFIKIPHSRINNDEKLRIKQTETERMLLETLRKHSLLFSTTGRYDVTKNLQANVLDNTEPNSRIRCDERFFWNLNSNKLFLDSGLDSFVTPVTNAFVTNKEIQCGDNKKKYQLTMISRRNRNRQGPRYMKRGSDGAGNVANFVETEQILQSEDGTQLSSFVQVRGSIPLLWIQPSSMWRRKQIPSLSTSDLMSHVKVLKLHLRELFNKYFKWTPTENETSEISEGHHSSPGSSNNSNTVSSNPPGIYFINLIDKVGNQGALGSWLYQAFKQLSSSHAAADSHAAPMNDLAVNRDLTTCRDFQCTSQTKRWNAKAVSFLTRYIWFDYHHRCKNGDFSQCRELLPLLSAGLDGERGGFFSAKFQPEGAAGAGVDNCSMIVPAGGGEMQGIRSPWRVDAASKMRLQSSVIRTNCMDCLDRTNVIQSLISLWVLERQLLLLNPEWKNTHIEVSFVAIWCVLCC